MIFSGIGLGACLGCVRPVVPLLVFIHGPSNLSRHYNLSQNAKIADSHGKAKSAKVA